MLRVKRNEAVNVADRWLIHGIYESDKGEEYFVWLKLPSWGMFYDHYRQTFRWGQRVLLYRGRHGFSIQAQFPMEDFS